MKLDLYSKLVLTVIAGCLLWICIKDAALATPVNAQSVQNVRLVGFDSNQSLPVTIDGISQGTYSVDYAPYTLRRPWSPLPVVQVAPSPMTTPTRP